MPKPLQKRRKIQADGQIFQQLKLRRDRLPLLKFGYEIEKFYFYFFLKGKEICFFLKTKRKKRKEKKKDR